MACEILVNSNPSPEVTALLKAWSAGDADALARLTPLVYDELRRMARRYMRAERAGNTLQPTALVHEAFLRLVDTHRADFTDRVHFFAVSAQVMRRILVDRARARRAAKRGGAAHKLNLDDAPEAGSLPDRELVALDDALAQLESIDPRKARVIELRFFGGLSSEEAAKELQVSPQTVLRDWKLAKAWLLREMSATQPAGPKPDRLA